MAAATDKVVNNLIHEVVKKLRDEPDNVIITFPYARVSSIAIITAISSKYESDPLAAPILHVRVGLEHGGHVIAARMGARCMSHLKPAAASKLLPVAERLRERWSSPQIALDEILSVVDHDALLDLKD